MKELLELVTPTLVTLIGLLCGYIGTKVVQLINEKIAKDEQDQIINIIKAAVLFVEQVSGEHLLSEDKLSLAKHRALATINHLGFKITDEELTMWIESFVYGLKGE